MSLFIPLHSHILISIYPSRFYSEPLFLAPSDKTPFHLSPVCCPKLLLLLWLVSSLIYSSHQWFHISPRAPTLFQGHTLYLHHLPCNLQPSPMVCPLNALGRPNSLKTSVQVKEGCRATHIPTLVHLIQSVYWVKIPITSFSLDCYQPYSQPSHSLKCWFYHLSISFWRDLKGSTQVKWNKGRELGVGGWLRQQWSSTNS